MNVEAIARRSARILPLRNILSNGRPPQDFQGGQGPTVNHPQFSVSEGINAQLHAQGKSHFRIGCALALAPNPDPDLESN